MFYCSFVGANYNICGVKCPTEDALDQHTESEHNVTETTFVEETEYECGSCNKVFPTEEAYMRHYKKTHILKLVRIKTEDIPAVLKPVKRSRAKVQYFKTKNFVCDMCCKSFSSNQALQDHRRTHTGERPFVCSVCPKSFTTTQGLQIHVRRHTGERPCKCSYCPKDFVSKAALNRHVRIHTGERPYTCQHCNKSFGQSNSLKAHIQTVHLKMTIPRRKKSIVDMIIM